MIKAVYDSLRVDEFAEYWKKMIESYTLEHNEWLNWLYEELLGSSVCEAYILSGNIFYTTYQKHEWYVHSKTSLKQFVTKYKMPLNEKYENEALADFDSRNKSPKLMSELGMEEQV